MKPLSIIAAVSRNGVIGANGTIPWHLPEDFKYFKATTLGHAVIMGRKTFESIGKPLPGRQNIVVSRTPTESTVLVKAITNRLVGVAGSLDVAIQGARETDPSPFVIGGAGLYAEAMPLATRMYLTEVHRDADGDVRFPLWEGNDWDEVSRVDRAEFSWVTLERVQAATLAGDR